MNRFLVGRDAVEIAHTGSKSVLFDKDGGLARKTAAVSSKSANVLVRAVVVVSNSPYDIRVERDCPTRLLISLQLALSPMVVLTSWIEHALLVPVDRLQRRRAGEENRIPFFGGSGQVICCAPHLLMIAFGLRDRLGEILDRIPQRRQRGAIVQHDGLVKAGQPALLAIGVEPFRQTRRFVRRRPIVGRAGRTSAAAVARVWAGPWLIGMVLANPAGVFAEQALHRPIMAFPAINGTYWSQGGCGPCRAIPTPGPACPSNVMALWMCCGLWRTDRIVPLVRRPRRWRVLRCQRQKEELEAGPCCVLEMDGPPHGVEVGSRSSNGR